MIRPIRWSPMITLALALCACGAAPAAKPEPVVKPPQRAPELGTGDHSAGSVVLTEIAGRTQRLRTPRDLAFNPLRPNELWVVNEADESVVIIHDASTDGRTTERRKDGYALHFMAVPAALAFGQDETTLGKPGTFATCGESRNTYDNQADPNDFMGPALWSSDLSIFAKINPNGLGSHLDMLHNTPLCIGIAHEEKNVYWVVGGLDGALFKYDFATDDGVGNDDHSDGDVFEYAHGELGYVPGVPSHLVYRPEDGRVYVADTGHGRIARLDPSAATRGAPLEKHEDMGPAYMMNGASLEDVVPAGVFTHPSGLELHADAVGDLLYVSDEATGVISAVTLDGGIVNYLETGLPAGSLSGMAFGPDGKLYVVDMKESRVLRLDPKAP